ncbi:MAG: lysophospholipid acyltransferase family protein [bacterium]
MNITVRLQKCGIALTKILPLSIADRIARFIGGFCYFFLKRKRGYILRNLYYIKSNHLEPSAVLGRRTFENFARCMIDFFRLGFLKKEEVIANVFARGLENLNKALEYGNGCILITLHIGNWDYAGSYLAALGYQINALVEETEAEMFRLYTKHREATGLKTFLVAQTSYAVLDTIKNNRILAVLADRDITKQGTVMNFFSGKRSFPVNLAGIIVKRRIPVVIGYMVLSNERDCPRRYLGVIEPLVIFKSEDEFSTHIIKRFESIIARYPDQWFVFHPEWIE